MLPKSVLALLLFISCVSCGLVDNIVDALENAVSCGSCHALLVPLAGLAHLGDSAFSGTIKAACNVLKLEDKDVCNGVIDQQGPIIAHDLRSISPTGQTATKLCYSLLGLCQQPAVNKYTVPFPKPAPTNPKKFVSTGKAPIQVVHFSDVHIDRQYAAGSDANCTKPICCRNYADSLSPPRIPAGPMGEHGCDTSTGLVQSMLRAIPGNNAFSIFTGDVVEAAVWLVDQKEVTSDLQTFNNEMATILGAPVYPVIGNHEAAPANSFPRNTTSQGSAQWVFDIQSQGWTKWIGAAGSNQVAHLSGSYSIVPPGTNLRIISINTVYWYKTNFWLFDSDKLQPDPNGILGFTVQQLQAAEDAGQRAWIIAHMPPGGRDTLYDQSNYFSQVVQRYRNTIAGQFYGHSHQDEFEIAYSDYTKQVAENAISVAWIAPSLTPRKANPAFRVYDVDPDTYEIMDSRVYISDLASPSFQSNPTWSLYYSARATYGPLVGLKSTDPLSPSFWHKVTEAFESNDNAFQQYNAFKTRGVGVTPCTGSCKSTAICGMRALRAENNCIKASPGLNFQRDLEVKTRGYDNDVHQDNDDCEGTSLGHIFAKLPGKLSSEDRAQLLASMEEAISNAQ